MVVNLHKVVAFLLIISFSISAKANCATTKEVQALNLKALESSLMVAALSCDQKIYYNNFAKKYNRELISNSKNIVSYFKRNYGKDYENNLNKFITRIANHASKFSMTSGHDYCQNTKEIFLELTKSNNEAILNLSNYIEYQSLHGIRACDKDLRFAENQ